MITNYISLKNATRNTIPDCIIEEGNGVTVTGLIENDDPLWQQLNRIYAYLYILEDGLWAPYGVFEWKGAVAVKPDVGYSALSDIARLWKGNYALSNFGFTLGPRVAGLYYQSGVFDLKFSRT